ESSCNSVLDCIAETAAHKATDYRPLICKCKPADRGDRRNDILMIDSQYNDTSDHIKKRHERNQFLAYACYTLYSAENNKCRQHRNHYTNNPWINPQISITDFCDSINLSRTSDTERCTSG